MPIGNITQTMSTISPPPHRGVDVQTVFVNKQEDFQDHLADITIDELNTVKDQLNTRIGEINSTATTMNGYADTASAGASTATTKAGEASASATAALNSKNQASTFASDSSYFETRARKWADNNYNAVVEAGKYSAKHWATEAQNATANKVDKVTSIDNAIVRFDGTTGAVQNSSVIIDDNGNVLAVSPTGGIGYGAGSGGTVTQLTSKSTAVTLNKPSGRIIMNSSLLAAGAHTSYIVNNSLITTSDNCIITISGGVSAYASYRVQTTSISGGCVVTLSNITNGSLSEAVVLKLDIIKGANS